MGDSKCDQKEFSSTIIYDGKKIDCSNLAEIIPNETSMDEVVKILGNEICGLLESTISSGVVTAKQSHNISFSDLTGSSTEITLNSGSGSFDYKVLANKTAWFCLSLDLSLTVVSGPLDAFLGILVQNLPITFDSGCEIIGEFSQSSTGSVKELHTVRASTPSDISLGKVSVVIPSGNYPTASIIVTGFGLII